MAVLQEQYLSLRKDLSKRKVSLVAVSKMKPVEDIQALYELGQRDFGENYVQELVEKAARLPNDIRWHYIGHLQSNKVKQIVPFVQLIHSVDSLKLAEEINKQSKKIDKQIDILLQVHIAEEETKFGLNEEELKELIDHLPSLTNIRFRGLMGMASFTSEHKQVIKEFNNLYLLFIKYGPRKNGVLSMGMSGDYELAIEEGSTLVRVGSLIFGERK